MSIIEPIVSGEVVSTGGGPISVVQGGGLDISPPAVVDSLWLLGARIYLKSATQYLADDYIRTTDAVYEGRVQNFGYIERSISAPAGPPRIGDCHLRIADTDQKFRKLLETQTGKRRLIELVRITDGSLVGGFEIVKWIFGDGYVEVRGQDMLSKWLNKPIPSLGTFANFPWMIGVPFFMPILFGLNFSNEANPQGKIKAHHMGPTTTLIGSTPVDRYAMARHILYGSGSTAIVYRKLRGDAAFSVVNPAEYVLTSGEYFTSNGQEWSPVYLDFLADQAADAEIRFDIEGLDVATIPGSGVNFAWGASELRQPIYFLSYVLFSMLQGIGGATIAARWNTANFETVLDLCTANNILCDGSITEAITPANFISRWCTSFEIDFFINRHYEMDVSIALSENLTRDVLTDSFDFIQVTPETFDEAFNRWDYQFDPNPATGKWARDASYEIVADQTELGNVDYQDNTGVVEVQPVQLHYVVDVATAASTILRRSAYERLGSHRVTFQIPLPEWFESMELTTRFGTTHYGGIKDGGWVNEEFKCLSVRDDLAGLVRTATAVLRVPVEFGAVAGSGAMTGGLVFLLL